MLGQKMGYEISASQIGRKQVRLRRLTLEGMVLENVDSIKYMYKCT